MRAEIANIVYPVIDQALEVKERLGRGETLVFEAEQAGLRRLVLAEGDPAVAADLGRTLAGAEPGGRRDPDEFLGVRYALACWLDETFIIDSPWADLWTEQKLESAMYGTNDRAWKFWEQAGRAGSRASNDALEVYYLCVMLGFRGAYREQLGELQAWIARTRGQLASRADQPEPAAPELTPPTYVPPLRAREQLRKLVMTAGLVLLVLIPFLAFLVIRQFGS